MYCYERNGRNDAAARTTSNYQLIQRVEQPNGFAQQTFQTSISFNNSNNFHGFYIGVRATSTCINIQHLQVYYNAVLYFWEVTSRAASCTQDCLSSPSYICDQVAQAMLTRF